MDGFAPLPDPPYWAVIFTNQRHEDDAGYAAMAEAMDALAAKQPGYIGIESVRAADGTGITVSYWKSEDDLLAWKKVAEHEGAQRLGRERWYKHYRLRVAKVERSYSGPEGRG
ncbi:MAG: antibiotic biosynthesis monooxygenase [Rhodobacteraceae bacterium]|nr:antibiotic biosynthesis monooxygenase [Paracoccaceae bacterium]